VIGERRAVAQLSVSLSFERTGDDRPVCFAFSST
jgi:hypothetical protein